ncbi:MULTISPECIES: hypothetical protein [unclassified Calothrix]|nr:MULTISPECIES: hypothetical protein [unclassified Calothrix]
MSDQYLNKPAPTVNGQQSTVNGQRSTVNGQQSTALMMVCNLKAE